MKPGTFLVFLLCATCAFGQMTVAQARTQIHSDLASFAADPLSTVETDFEAILNDSPRNIEAVVAIAEILAEARFETDIFVFYAMCASKALVASQEFVVLAQDEALLGSETFYRRLTALELVAAKNKGECSTIMAGRPYHPLR